MAANIKLTEIRGVTHYGLPMNGKIVVRGLRKGAKAKPGKCYACQKEILIGEQYIRCGDEIAVSYCLACAVYD